MYKIFLFFMFINLFSCAGGNFTKKVDSVVNRFSAQDALLTQFTYPYQVHYFHTEVQNQKIDLAYMDITPQSKVKKTIVLFHGKNFSGFYFENIIKELVPQGYRVIALDQMGFGKSSKPENIQYSFPLLATLSNKLLKSIAANEFILIGHSMGGMLATRYALIFPVDVKKLILVNPIGLEDYKNLVSYKTVDELYEMELKNSETKIREYQKNSYYDGVWKNEYDQMIAPAVGWTLGPDQKQIAMNSALTSEMIYSQPVVYEFKNLLMPTILIIGQRDKTAIGKAWAHPNIVKLMGNYPKLGTEVAAVIPKGKLIPMPGLGHLPFVEDLPGFIKILNKELE